MRHLLLILLVIITMFIFSCSRLDTEIDLSTAETEWLEKNISSIEFIPDPSFMPFEGFNRRGVYSGIGADFLSEIEKRLSVKFRVKKVDNWSTAYRLLLDRKSAGVLSLVKTPERKDQINFTDPYMNVPIVILSREELNPFKALNRALVYKTGITIDYAYYDTVKKKYPYLEYVDLKTDIEGIKQLSYGNIDLLVINIASAEYYMREYGLTNLKVSSDTELSLEFAIALNKDMPLLHSIFQKVLSSIPENEKKQIIDKWISFRHPWYDKYPKLFIFLIIEIIVLVIALAAFALVFFINRTLKTRVQAKTDELTKTEEFLKELLEIIPDPVFVKDSSHKYLLVNKAFTDILGKNADSILGKTELDLFPEKEALKFMNSDKKVLNKNIVLEYEEEHKDPDGIIHNVLAKKRAFTRYNDEKNIVTILHDITELRNREKELMQSQKLETIGRLSGGFAHDFNNVLAGITGPIELIEYTVSSKKDFSIEQVLEFTAMAKKASERAKKIIQQLLSISRKKEIKLESVNVKTAVRNVIDITTHSFDKQVEIKLIETNKVLNIMGDNSMLEQALLNILINAYHSMTLMRSRSEEWGGIITIELSEQTIIHPENRDNTVIMPGTYCIIRISDTGTGIDEKTKKLIFEPFFSTKKGKGSGLGLTMVMNIVNSFNGAIDIVSEPGKGTDFTVFFPKTTETDNFKNSLKDQIITGSGNIVIIDDEEGILETASNMFELCGYSTKCFSNGDDALKYIEKNRNAVDLVLLDYILPGLSSENTFRSIKKLNPEIPFILTSGSSNNERIETLMSEGIECFIAKPFTTGKLSSETAKILFKKA